MKKSLIAMGIVGVAIIAGALSFAVKRNAPAPEPKSKSLYEAAKEGRLSQVEAFLSRGAKIDEKGPRGQTPLIAAITMNHEEVARRLVAKGANVAVADERGLTAAHYAAANNEVDALKDVEAKGAKLDIANKEGFTPIYLAKTYRSQITYNYLKMRGLKETASVLQKKDPSKRLSAGPR